MYKCMWFKLLKVKMNVWTNRRTSWIGFILIILGIMVIFSTSSIFQKSIFSKKTENLGPPIICTHQFNEKTEFLEQVKNNATVLIPDFDVLQRLNHEELAAFYHRYVENDQYFCKRIIRLGKISDGGWDVCDDDEYRPHSPCLVYSFGINNDFSFDDAVIKEYGCEVHSFDPSMKVKTFQRSKHNFFYELGLASTNHVNDEGWTLQNLETIQKNLKHTKRKVSIFKMDIETWEWDVIPSIVNSWVAERIDNLLVEVHLNLYDHSAESDTKDYLRALKNLKLLYDAGFRIFRTHRNPTNIFVSKCTHTARANCHELHMVRLKRA